VVTDTPVAREVCGDAACYVASGDLDGITRSLEAMLFDSQVRRQVLDRAPAVLARYSWERAARETLAALEEAVGSKPGNRPPTTDH
jgi:glycosyltransferase involved in cell wall biosynthesis